jgi:hypothetical protein
MLSDHTSKPGDDFAPFSYVTLHESSRESTVFIDILTEFLYLFFCFFEALFGK